MLLLCCYTQTKRSLITTVEFQRSIYDSVISIILPMIAKCDCGAGLYESLGRIEKIVMIFNNSIKMSLHVLNFNKFKIILDKI